MELDIKKSKILGSYYDVEYVEDLRDPDDGHKISGRIIEADKLIKIEKSLGLQNKLQTLMHEDIHGLCWEYAVDDPEKYVRVFSSGLFALIVDNPEFIIKILKFATLQKRGVEKVPYEIKKVDGYKVFHGKKAKSKKAKSLKAAKRHKKALDINVTLKEKHPSIYKKLKSKKSKK